MRCTCCRRPRLRAAQDAGGAAAARRLHDGDDGAREDSRDDPLALPGLRAADDRHQVRLPISSAGSSTPRRSRVSDEALQLIARDADGSMRDAQSKLDQVIAFTGETINAEDVAAVLGLVGREFLLETLQAVATRTRSGVRARRARRRNGATTCGWCAASSRAPRATCSCCRSTVARHPIRRLRASPSAIVCSASPKRFSREDLLRSFDLLTQHGSRHQGPRRSRAITSRWRCCAGSTCQSWCRSKI